MALAKTSAEHPGATNHLINETSPYLLQHAHNPVDWYPWGTEALQRARAENKPIFLSIGYSACHWCHVMERESFEDVEIAALLNEHFVCIKVDREERPDLDELYMTAVQLMRGNGGWPLNVFLTPDLKPFFGGTYFPPRYRHGLPGFRTVLEELVAVWAARHDDVAQSAEELADAVRRAISGRPSIEQRPLEPALMVHAGKALRETFDPVHGGFGAAPKFPSAAAIGFLLRTFHHTGDAVLLGMASATLRHMAHGGIYDHLGGGFHRYSVDAAWLVPHFEKMLYDNAQLAQAYLEGYQATHDPLFERVARSTLDYVLREMTDPCGGFHSSEDADSEGEEGAFYLWTRNEILSVLGHQEGEECCAYYGVREDGNFTSPESYHAGKNILHATRPSERTAHRLASARAKLLEVRAHRACPARDDKVLVSWNALMVSALAGGYQVLREDRYRRAATRAASFILDAMMRDGRLLRTYRNGRSRFPAYLDDYAFLVVALIDLYEATFDVHWLQKADELAQTMIDAFWDSEAGGFFFTSAAHTDLIARSKPIYDGAVPSGNAMAVQGLLRLAELRDAPAYRDRAQTVLTMAQPMMARSPQGTLTMLCAADLWLHPPKEIAIAGAPDSATVQGFLKALYGHFVPEKVVALVDPAAPGMQELRETIPLLGACALVSGKPAAYVCENFTCDLPATTPEALLSCLGLPPD